MGRGPGARTRGGGGGPCRVIAGFSATSNLERAVRSGVPDDRYGRTLVHAPPRLERRPSSPRSRRSARTPHCLVRTYGIEDAVRTGVRISGGRLGAVRIDPATSWRRPRRYGRCSTSFGRDETRKSSPATSTSGRSLALSGAPVNGSASAPRFVTGSGHPTCSFVLKLVARARVRTSRRPPAPVAKKSMHKSTVGGGIRGCAGATRRLAEAELIGIGAGSAGRRRRPPAPPSAGHERGGRGQRARERRPRRHEPPYASFPGSVQMSAVSPGTLTVFSSTATATSTPTRRQELDMTRSRVRRTGRQAGADRPRRPERLLARAGPSQSPAAPQAASDISAYLAGKGLSTTSSSRPATPHRPRRALLRHPDFIDRGPRHCVVGTPGQDFHPG